MTEIIKFDINDIIPEREEVLRNQGIIPGAVIEDKIRDLLEQAMQEFQSLAEPVGIMKEVLIGDFKDIYKGEGLNDERTPVADIFPKADCMALFAVTLSQKISDEIDQRFNTNNFAEGCMLDAAASAGADQAAEIMQKMYEQIIAERFDDFAAIGLVRYSPGYCGWHISAQKKLFEYLNPDKIGINLRKTYLMDPLKSVSGVIIAGPKEIHQFENNYPCCDKCDDQTCLELMQVLKNA